MSSISTPDFEHALEAWPTVAPILFLPRNEAEYDKLVDVLNHLLDQGVVTNSTHSLISSILLVP